MKSRSEHELAAQRSLELHRQIAARLRDGECLRDAALTRIQRWRREGLIAEPYARAWEELLGAPIEQLVAALLDEGETGRALRQATPFTFVIQPRERWRIWRDVRARWEKGS
jgi:hypothetical protein